ncbi:MAG: hypothetical protein E7257_05165 [Lachnospiraceae bacterium]|nr:hypothetical protein [Lachnospiraceae bacterium]MBQ9935920.1 YabP/YqfC family sporulation protein [Lachnospiraceae bacterium]
MTKSVILSNNTIYIEDYKNIEYFDDKLIMVCCKKINISIEGSELQIDSYNKYSLKISGDINIIKYYNGGNVLYD